MKVALSSYVEINENIDTNSEGIEEKDNKYHSVQTTEIKNVRLSLVQVSEYNRS